MSTGWFRARSAAAFAILGVPACGGASAPNADGAMDSGTGLQAMSDGSAVDASAAGPDANDGIASDAQTFGSSDAGAAPSCDTLPPEPTIPPACATLVATQAVAAGSLPDETTLDTVSIQSALNGCGSGKAVKLTASGSNNAFISGPLSVPSGVMLWVDADTTLYASRNPATYGATCGASGGTCSSFISVLNANSGIMGNGTIDGQGGEPILGQTQSWWQLTGTTNGASANPTLIETLGARNFTMYEITLHNSPKFHVKLDANGFVVWGITIKTPSAATNSQGTPLTPSDAHNTDGIDPGESASNGYIVHNDISDGDDQIAIKGGSPVHDLVIAHNHFLSGHGMSIGSETNGGVTNISVCDLSIDGTVSAGSSNGIRIKSYPGVGGPVSNVSYTDVCVRGLENPIDITPFYATGTGSIPEYNGITIRDFHAVGTSPPTHVTIDGYDSAHVTGLTLDNVILDTPPMITAQFADVALGPGAVNFSPSGDGVVVVDDVADASAPNPCTDKWVSF
jgi:polygalacturonase